MSENPTETKSFPMHIDQFGKYRIEELKQFKQLMIYAFVCQPSLRLLTNDRRALYVCTELLLRCKEDLFVYFYQLFPHDSEDVDVPEGAFELKIALKQVAGDELKQTLLIDECNGRIFHLVHRVSASYTDSNKVASIALRQYDAVFDPSDGRLIKLTMAEKTGSIVQRLGHTTAPTTDAAVKSIALVYLDTANASKNSDLFLYVFCTSTKARWYALYHRGAGRRSGLDVHPWEIRGGWFDLTTGVDSDLWLADIQHTRYSLSQRSAHEDGKFNGLLANSVAHLKPRLFILPPAMQKSARTGSHVICGKQLMYVSQDQLSPHLLTVISVDMHELLQRRCFTCGNTEVALRLCRVCKRLAAEWCADFLDDEVEDVVAHRLRFCSRRCLKTSWSYHNREYHGKCIYYRMMYAARNISKHYSANIK